MFRRKKKGKQSSRDGEQDRVPGRIRTLLRLGTALILSTLALTGVLFGLRYLERQVIVKRSEQPVTAVRVAFTVRPAWLPRPLAEEIAKTLILPKAEFLDDDLTANVYKRAASNPWIRQVNRVTKRRTSEDRIALVEIDCGFRMPIARVLIGKESNREFAYVDIEGYRLPSKDVPQWIVEVPPAPSAGNLARPTQIYFRDNDLLPPQVQAKALHYITIRGVEAPAPPVSKQWAGGDIREGLKLVNLVLTHACATYANQIATVDVRNYANRISKREPWLRMVAQVDDGPSTEIYFGRFEIPGGGDFEIGAEQKMAKLDEFFADKGNKLAGAARRVDLQYDDVHYIPN